MNALMANRDGKTFCETILEQVSDIVGWRQRNLECLLRACAQVHGVMLRRVEPQGTPYGSANRPCKVYAGTRLIALYWVDFPELDMGGWSLAFTFEVRSADDVYAALVLERAEVRGYTRL